MTTEICIATAGHNKEVCRLEVDVRSENGSNTNLQFINPHRLYLQQKDLACNAIFKVWKRTLSGVRLALLHVIPLCDRH